jgi:uncharacterized surface anchored protein
MTVALRVICIFILLLPAWPQQLSSQASEKFRISGTAINAATGQPLADALIAIGLAQKQETTQSVQTDESGHFLFEGLATGKYWLVGERPGFLRQGFNEHSGFFTAIVVGPGLRLEDLVFRMRPDASISGTITDEQNEAIREAQVHLFAEESDEGERRITQRPQVITDSEGHYRFSHLRPGKYFIAVSAKPWYAMNQQAQAGSSFSNEAGDGPSRDSAPQESTAKPSPLDVAYPLTYYADAVEPENATPIILKPGDREKADITLSAVPALRVRIVTGASSPNTGFGATVFSRALGDTSIPVPVAQINPVAGKMEISGLAPGDYTLDLTSFGKEPRDWRQSFRLTTDVEIDGIRTHASPTVTGAVTLDGAALSGAGYVVLRDPASGNAFGAQVNSKGEFEFPSQAVRPRTYQISVFNVPGATVTAVSASGARVTGQSVSIEDEATIKLIVSMSKSIGEVSGVAERDGNAIAGAMVVLVPEKLDGNETLFRRDQTDSDGSFSLRDIVPGKYTLVAIEQGWDLEWGKANVLRPYLTDGQRIEIAAKKKYQVKIKVQ